MSKELNKVSRQAYANDPTQPDTWLVIEGEATKEAVDADKARIIGQANTEAEADRLITERAKEPEPVAAKPPTKARPRARSKPKAKAAEAPAAAPPVVAAVPPTPEPEHRVEPTPDYGSSPSFGRY
jgi:hypothetical protein